MTTSNFQLHFTKVDAYIEELRLDIETGSVQDGIVRLAVVSGSAPGTLRPDRAQSWYAESTYISTRQQLVKVSLFAGWKWQGSESIPLSSEDNAHNKGVENTIRETLLRLQAPLQKVTGIKLRGGSLVESQEIWQPGPEQEITTPEPLKCATCAESIYYANDAWRHKATGRAEAVEDAECGACKGSSYDRNRRLCTRCQGNGFIKGGKLNHVAEPVTDEDFRLLNGVYARGGE